MTRRTSADWQVLVDKQIASGLSVPQFCDEHQLSAKYFYARKTIINKTCEQTHFIQAQVVTKQTTLMTSKPEHSIKLKTPIGELSFPHGICATFIAQLIKELST